jgi:hypothetical protein
VTLEEKRKPSRDQSLAGVRRKVDRGLDQRYRDEGICAEQGRSLCEHRKTHNYKFEEIRSDFKPTLITTLFVGESRPKGGTFFYKGDSRLYKAMQKCFSFGANFLPEFKASGFFLDDLVLYPVNHYETCERTAHRRRAVSSLAKRMTEYRPSAVVALMCAIEPMVREAMIEAGLSKVPLYVTPYPNHGNQMRFKTKMNEIIPKLPSTKVSTKAPQKRIGGLGRAQRRIC